MDWVRLHAALNDLPAALLLAAVLFEAAGAVLRRESLRAAGFWSLVAGVAGTGLAIGAGLMAEDVVAHDEAAHELMERHETLAFVVLGVFAVLLLWRLVRRTMGRAESSAFVAVGAVGVAILIAASRIGGSLVFDHGMGVTRPATAATGQPADSTGEGHEHAPGTPPHQH